MTIVFGNELGGAFDVAAVTTTPDSRMGTSDVHKLLTELSNEAADPTQMLSGAAQIAAAATDAETVAVTFPAPASSEFPKITILVGVSQSIEKDVLRRMYSLAKEACDRGIIAVRDSNNTTFKALAAIPIAGHVSQCFLVVFRHRPILDLQLAVWGLAAAHVANRQLADDKCRAEALSLKMAAVTDLIARVQAANDHKRACQVVADELKTHLNCRQVIVGICSNNSQTCRVVAISGTETIDPQIDEVRFAQAAMQESIARGDLSTWPVTEETGRHALLAHRQFASHAKTSVVITCPLKSERGSIRGVVLVADDDTSIKQTETRNFLRAIDRPLAAALSLLESSRQGRIQTILTAASQLLRDRRGQVVITVLLACASILFIPVLYKVKCDCELQPVVRRFVAAPFDGQLERSFVKAGDVVSADQLVARMDGHEIHWEMAGVSADLHRAAKERAGHVATHEFGKSEVTRHEVDRLTARTQLLEHRAEHLDVRSPIDGIVVSGDLDKAQGIPLTVGETLFEIAPLDLMVVEVAIPEDDIPYVASGMIARMRLDAFPSRSFEATIERIHPRSELKDHLNVFVAEVTLVNDHHALRPGMRGKARITTDRHPLGWNLFHRAWAAGLEWIGW